MMFAVIGRGLSGYVEENIDFFPSPSLVLPLLCTSAGLRHDQPTSHAFFFLFFLVFSCLGLKPRLWRHSFWESTLHYGVQLRNEWKWWAVEDGGVSVSSLYCILRHIHQSGTGPCWGWGPTPRRPQPLLTHFPWHFTNYCKLHVLVGSHFSEMFFLKIC